MISKIIWMLILCGNCSLFAASAGAGAGAGAGASAGDEGSEPTLIDGVLPIVLSPKDLAIIKKQKELFARQNPRGHAALQLARSNGFFLTRTLDLTSRTGCVDLSCYEVPGPQKLGSDCPKPVPGKKVLFETPWTDPVFGGAEVAKYTTYGKK